jgi:RNA binding exosome subunit
MRVARLTLHTPARTYDEIVCAAMADDGRALHPEVAERMLQIPAVDLGGLDDLQQTGSLYAVLEERQTEIVGKAQERLGQFLNEEEERLDAWRDDAKVSYDQQIKALNKDVVEKKKLARATANLQAKLDLQREAKHLQANVDDLQHQLYTRLREIDAEREAMLDEVSEKLSLTPTMSDLFTIRWSLV